MAEPLATTADVEARWRPLTSDENTVATTLLADASAMLRHRIPDIDQQITDGDVDPDVVAGVVAWSAVRVLRNPRGARQETIGDYSYTRAEGDTGELMLTAHDLELLSPNAASGAFTIGLPYGSS